ncbi:hypothetical protein ACWX0O_01860 [Nitrobacteraceae bacterium UC4449_H16]
MATKKPAAKPVAKRTKDKPNVNTDDPLADLGLDTDTAAPAVVASKPATTTTASVVVAAAAQGSANEGADVGNEEVEVGEIEFGFSEFIPTSKRKVGGSKYKFDDLVAPSVWADGPHKGKPKIANFFVKLQAGVDPDKLRRSVQSATTQANRQGSDEGKYFVSRSATKDGKFIGMIVYRTDDRPKK